MMPFVEPYSVAIIRFVCFLRRYLKRIYNFNEIVDLWVENIDLKFIINEFSTVYDFNSDVMEWSMYDGRISTKSLHFHFINIWNK